MAYLLRVPLRRLYCVKYLNRLCALHHQRMGYLVQTPGTQKPSQPVTCAFAERDNRASANFGNTAIDGNNTSLDDLIWSMGRSY